MPRKSRRKAQSGMCKLVAKPDLNTSESAPVEQKTELKGNFCDNNVFLYYVI